MFAFLRQIGAARPGSWDLFRSRTYMQRCDVTVHEAVLLPECNGSTARSHHPRPLDIAYRLLGDPSGLADPGADEAGIHERKAPGAARREGRARRFE